MFRSILTIYILVSYSVSQEIRKICSNTPTDSACQQLARTPDVRCNYNQHNVDCLLNIQNNQSHLGRITGEEAMLGSNLLASNVVVLGEIRNLNPATQTVVIVKNNMPNGIDNWRNKTLCHPGYKHDASFPHFMLKEIEDQIIEKYQPSCQDNITLLERRISALSQFFADSCRPGPWSENTDFDKILKEKYSSLCVLCGSAKCDVDYSNPFKNSLDCLLRSDADIALTTLQEAVKFFKTPYNKNNYKYMCKDGSSKIACFWSGKPSDLVVSERSASTEIENFLRQNLGSYINTTQSRGTENNIGEALTTILNLKGEQITFLEESSSPVSLRDYVYKTLPTVPTPSSGKQCDRTIKWCTVSNEEQKKCQWLSQAAVLWGIEPVIDCVQTDGNDELHCLDDIKDKRADIMVASSDYSYVALSKNLSGIAFPEVDRKYLLATLAVKKAGDGSIVSFQDMVKKRACFSRYGGREQLAFVDTIRQLGITDKQCNYGRILNDNVGDSCIPGVKSSILTESTQCLDKTKFCQQCRRVNNSVSVSDICNSDNENIYFGDDGALQCLEDKQGDFAIITYNSRLANNTDLTVICKNNTVASVNGLSVDENCALFVFTSSAVVSRSNDTMNEDVKLVLYEFERWFGQNLKKSFYLFDRFNNKRNLLFLDSTLGLNFDDSVSYIKNYKELLSNAKRCSEKCDINGSPSRATSIFNSIFALSLFCFVFICNILI